MIEKRFEEKNFRHISRTISSKIAKSEFLDVVLKINLFFKLPNFPYLYVYERVGMIGLNPGDVFLFLPLKMYLKI